MLHNRLPYFASLIERELGIVYSDANFFQLQNRLEEMVKFFGLKDIEELHLRTANGMGGAVRQLLLDVATNNETSFFRDPKIYKALQVDGIPGLIAANGGSSLRIWSAAASTGQESYSLAMMLKDLGGAAANSTIIATDISARVLEKASKGQYTNLDVQRGLPIALLPKYFTKVGPDAWLIDPALRSVVTFKRFNLLEPFLELGLFDLILCRNMLIYQRIENKIEIVRKIVRALRPGGVLVLGAGESLLGISDAFEQVQSQDVVFYRLKRAAATAPGSIPRVA